MRIRQYTRREMAAARSAHQIGPFSEAQGIIRKIAEKTPAERKSPGCPQRRICNRAPGLCLRSLNALCPRHAGIPLAHFRLVEPFCDCCAVSASHVLITCLFSDYLLLGALYFIGTPILKNSAAERALPFGQTDFPFLLGQAPQNVKRTGENQSEILYDSYENA